MTPIITVSNTVVVSQAGSSGINGVPSLLSATVVSYSEIDLSWTNGSTNEDGISIERSDDGVTFSEVDTVAAGVSTYADTPLPDIVQYWYRVRGYKGSQYSTYSNTATIDADDLWVSYWAGQDWANTEFGNNQALCTADALINAAQPTYNYGSTIAFAVGEYNSASGTITRSLLKFNLSAIPADAIILSAKLYICRANDLSDNARTLRVYRIKRNWTEGTKNAAAPADGVTWNTYNGTDAWQTAGGFGINDCEQTEIGSLDLTASETAVYKIISLNVSSLSELDLGYGLFLKMDTELNDAYTYQYRGHATLYPYLRIKYMTLSNGTYTPLITKSVSNPFISGCYFGSIVYNGANNYIFYAPTLSDGDIHRYTSPDGIIWTDTGSVLGSGNVFDVCSAWKEGSTWYMLYRSDEWGGDKSIGLATSSDGITWSKEATNPVITKTDIGVWCTGDIDPWGIIKVGSTYYLWVNDVGEVPRQTGLMTSTDLINWTPNANNPIFGNGRYCASPIKYNSNYYLFIPYTPEGNVTGADPWAYRIEVYKDSDPRFLSTSREYIGVILLGGEDGEWDDDYIDTPSIITGTIERDTFPIGSDENGRLYMYYTGHSGSVWAHGLAIGHLEMLEQLTTLAEPGAGE